MTVLAKQRKPSRYHLRSQIEVSSREELNQLFFFNPQQFKVKEQVMHSVARYGAPEIQGHGQLITLGLMNFPGAQTLFILGGKNMIRLQGALIYIREKERLLVLYLTLKPSAIKGWKNNCALLVYITQILRGIALQISGVQVIEFRVGEKPVYLRIRQA